MAIKKFLMEGQKQVWPITRADCVYTVAGDKLLNVAIEEQHAALQKAIDDEIARAKAAEKANADAIAAEKERAEAAEQANADEIANMKNAELEGSLANKIAANAAAVAQEVQDRKDAVQGVQDQLDALVGDGEGSIADQIADAKEELQGAIDDVQEALDNEKDPAVEGSLAKQIADEAAARLAKDNDLEGRVAANEAFVAAQPAIDQAQNDRLKALEDANAEGGAVANAIKQVADDLAEFEGEAADKHQAQDQAIQAAQNAADKAQQEVDALEAVVGNKAGTDAEGNTIEASGMMKDIAANAAAIAKEAGDRAAADTQIRTDFAAADAQVLADAKAYADEKDTADKNAQAAIDNAQNDRIKALEDANAEGGAVANAIKAVADDLAEFEAAQAEKDAAQDKAISDEAARAQGEEQRIEGLVTAEAERAVAKENEIAQAVADEAARADAAEKANAQAIADEQARAEGVEAELEQAIKDEAARAAAAEAKALEDAKKYTDDQILAADVPGQIQEAVDGMTAAVEAEAARADAAEKALQTNINNEVTARESADNALDARLDVIEGEGEGSVKKALADAKSYADEKIAEVNGAAADLEGRVKANEDKLAGLENATVKAEIEAAQAAAEKHADDAITALVDSAPEAMNTLNELAKAINDNKDVYDAYVEEHATAMANMKTELQAEIDADVKAEADRAKAEEADIRADFAAADAALKTELQAEIDADVKVEVDRAKAAEEALDAKINSIFAAYDGDQEYDDLAPLA